MKIKCNKCEATANGVLVGTKHQACSPRKKGDGTPRKASGIWVQA